MINTFWSWLILIEFLIASSFFEKKNIDLPIANKSKNRIIVSRSHSGTVITEIQKQIEKPDLISAAGSGI